MASRPLVVALAGLEGPALAQAPPCPQPRGTPEEAGFSGARLARIGEVLNRDIAAGRLPGVVLAIARDGRLVFLEAYGFRDEAAGARMTTDTISDVASMTKPMTAWWVDPQRHPAVVLRALTAGPARWHHRHLVHQAMER